MLNRRERIFSVFPDQSRQSIHPMQHTIRHSKANPMQDPSLRPAFPVPSDATHAGVSCRDWFAAVALQGIAARGLEVFGDRVISEDEKNTIMATRAYAMADAMIAVGQATAKQKQKSNAQPSANPRSRQSARPNRPAAAPPKCDTPQSPESSV